MPYPPPLDYASPQANREGRRYCWRRVWWLRWAGGVVVVIGAVAIFRFYQKKYEITDTQDVTTAARTDISNIETALDAFKTDTGRYPTQAEGLKALVQSPPGLANWKGPYLKRIYPDPFGRPYLYTNPPRHLASDYDLSSCGPDNLPGTQDDIGNGQTP